ncbi:MAG: hypothetical protein JRK53_01420 [Deltaproteobacteria bacterium]|nr:hypothetical protein [Deltaproteobacteria bacterium]MBW1815523.1 hypothetical protein [Deltaproteobacteria bacterium]
MPAGYDIRHFRPTDVSQVIRLQRHLWGDDLDSNLSYFKWKYEDNPYADKPLGIVALHNGKVVGFRGFPASIWNVPASNRQLRILHSGDSVVDPDHRLKGLFIIMGDFAASEYESAYDVFLNTSASKNSAPGYVKTGFGPLITKKYLTRYNTINLATKYIFNKFNDDYIENNPEHSEYDRFIVSPSPIPEAMSAVVSSMSYHSKKISLLKDIKFFKWKFNNKRDNFHFYFYRESDAILGYMVIRSYSRLRRGLIFDYAAVDERILEQLVHFIARSKRYNVLTILDAFPEKGFGEILRRMKFTSDSLLGKIEKRVTGEWPIFVKPIKAHCEEKDWFVQGLDIRKFQNWAISSVCSD